MDVIRSRVVLRERAMLDVADLALRFVMTHARVYAKLGALLLLPCFALTWGASAALGWGPGWIVTVALTSLAGAPFVALASRLVFSDHATAGEAIRVAGRALPGLLPVRITQLLAVLLGAALLVLPALWVACLTLFAVEVHVLERTGRVGATLRRANRISRARLGAAFGAAIVCASVPVAAAMVADVSGREFLARVLEVGQPQSMFTAGGSWLALCGWWVTLPFVATARFFLYLDFRTRTEGWDIQTRFAAIAARAQTDAAERSPSSLRPPVAALLILASLALASAPRTAAAEVDPSHARQDVATTLADRGYSFCRQPREPLTPEAYALCGHAAVVAGCEGFAAACARAEKPTAHDLEPPKQDAGWMRFLDALVRPAVWLLVAFVVALVLFPIVRALAARRRQPKATIAAAEMPADPKVEEAIETASDAEVLLARADDLARHGQGAMALELYLGASLRALHERGSIRLSKDRTNGEYVRSCGDRALRPTLAGLVGDVEHVKFGGRAASEGVVAHSGRRATTIVRALSATTALVVLMLAGGCGFRAHEPGDDPAGSEVWTALLRKQGFDFRPLGGSLATLPMPESVEDAPAVVVRAAITELDERAREHLVAWVREGGVLVLEGESHAWPEPFRPQSTSPRHGRVSVRFGNRTEQADLEDSWQMDGLPDDTSTIATFDDGSVYGARFSYGEGTVLAIASDELMTNVALTRGENAAAMVAMFVEVEGHPLSVAHEVDGVTPPSTPMDALAHAGLTLGAWHALVASALLFLAVGVRLTRAAPAPPPPSRPFSEHVRAVGALYGRAGAAPLALAAYARFAQERWRTRMPRRMTDVPTFLAVQAHLPVDVGRRLWERATAAAGPGAAAPSGDELAVLEELVAAYSITTKESA